MNAISGYLWRIVCAAVVCALADAIAGAGPGSQLRKWIAGLFLVLTVLSPFGDLKLPKLDMDRIQTDAQTAVQEGLEQAQEAKNARIIQEMETYIWNKAAELGMELQVHVRLGRDGLPQSVELTAEASAAEQQMLGNCIARDLGLGKEAQIWIEPYQSSE